MLKRLKKFLVAALAVIVVVAPMVFAQQSPQTGTGTIGSSATTGSTGQPMQRQLMSPPATGTQLGTMEMQNTISATVAEVNQEQKTVRLRMQNGQIVEMKVPDQLLTDLKQGDSVQIFIHKPAG